MRDFKAPPPDLLNSLLNRCLDAGADAADARLVLSDGISVEVRGGALETVERSEAQGVALRCFFGKRQAHVSGSDLSDDALSGLVERVTAMARSVPEDPYCGLPDAGALASGALDLDLDVETLPDAGALEADALAAEAAALGVEGVRTVSSCSAGWSRSERWVAASNGFASHKRASTIGLGLAAVAERDGRMERDYDSWTVRRLSDRPGPQTIGRTAGERTIARLGARKLSSRKAPVIYDRRVSTSLLGAFLSAISGPAIARGVSFLKERMDTAVFAAGVTVIDDPAFPLGLGTRSHDGEGRPVSESRLIDAGRLTAWLLNGASARQLGLTPNGFASGGFGTPPGVGTSNVHMTAGAHTPDRLMRDAGAGLLVTDMFGPSINPNTGDYSVGVAGFWFEDGEIAYPVSEVTVAGDLPAMFARLVPASDLRFERRVEAPSVLIDAMSLAGS